MNSHVIRLMPQGSVIVKSGNIRKAGTPKINIPEDEIIKHLLLKNTDILVRKESRKKYLLNKGIEMLIHTESGYISMIEMRICLSFITRGLSEAFDIIMKISEILPLCDYLTNETAEDVNDRDEFIKRHTEYISEKYEIFQKAYPDLNNVRLTEGELYRHAKHLPIRTALFKYSKIKIH